MLKLFVGWFEIYLPLSADSDGSEAYRTFIYIYRSLSKPDLGAVSIGHAQNTHVRDTDAHF